MHQMRQAPGSFDDLTPHAVTAAVEAFFDLSLDGTVDRYASYVNRVYGLRTTLGEHVVAKFYRPDRWSEEAILEEHRLLQELEEREVPVVAPLRDTEGDTLLQIELDDDAATGVVREDGDDGDGPPLFSFALFPRRGGRSFDAENDEDWMRLGAIIGRMHQAAGPGEALHRLRVDPESWTGAYVRELLQEEIVHPDCADEFEEIAQGTVERIAPLFQGLPLRRIHGDCHRGNILDRPGEGLLLFDFDDMMNGPAVQDLWLLLPDRAGESMRELTMLLEGYEQFLPLDRNQLELIEPLRFMRMIHFLAWRARQRFDNWFEREHPGWGNRSFWIKEVEDLREQSGAF
ncbi:MAG: serine/threonine protein kinase [Spirochaetaceae bacterium]|nr:MAG: serine/threonine protein kinase [Spirochaetaceae bacterium]